MASRRVVPARRLHCDQPGALCRGHRRPRGTCEQYIKEGKNAIKWTRLSCRCFAANAVRLQLHAVAYNLGNFMRTLAMPKTAEPWSLTSLREKPDGRGGGAVIDVRRHPVANRGPSGTVRACVTGGRDQMRQASDDGRGAPRCGQSNTFQHGGRSTGGFDRLLRTRRAICRCSRRPKGRFSSRNDPESGECRLNAV